MRAIARGDLKPGQRLNEAQMAQSLGVSRGPIREAARELEGQGFLVSRPNQGFYVADFAPDAIRDVYEAKDWLETAFVADLARSLPLAERRAILAEIDALDVSDRLAFTETLFAFRARVLARLAQPLPRRSDDGALPQVLHHLGRRRRRATTRAASSASPASLAPTSGRAMARDDLAEAERRAARRHRLLARRPLLVSVKPGVLPA